MKEGCKQPQQSAFTNLSQVSYMKHETQELTPAKNPPSARARSHSGQLWCFVTLLPSLQPTQTQTHFSVNAAFLTDCTWTHNFKGSVQLGVKRIIPSQEYNSKMQPNNKSLSLSYILFCRHLRQGTSNRALASVSCRVYATATPKERARPNGAENTEQWLSATAKRLTRGGGGGRGINKGLLCFHKCCIYMKSLRETVSKSWKGWDKWWMLDTPNTEKKLDPTLSLWNLSG